MNQCVHNLYKLLALYKLSFCHCSCCFIYNLVNHPAHIFNIHFKIEYGVLWQHHQMGRYIYIYEIYVLHKYTKEGKCRLFYILYTYIYSQFVWQYFNSRKLNVLCMVCRAHILIDKINEMERLIANCNPREIWILSIFEFCWDTLHREKRNGIF